MNDIKGLNERKLIKAFSLSDSEIFRINSMPEFKADLLTLLEELEYYKEANQKLKDGFIPKNNRVQPKIKPIEVTNLKTGEKEVYESAFHAAKATGFKQADILTLSRLRKTKIHNYDFRRLEGYKVCVECGFFGKKKGNFPESGIQNGKKTYRKLCKKCYAKRAYAKRKGL